jgi:hypothetical protein
MLLPYKQQFIVNTGQAIDGHFTLKNYLKGSWVDPKPSLQNDDKKKKKGPSQESNHGYPTCMQLTILSWLMCLHQ